MDDERAELLAKLQEANKKIIWLEQEVHRLKMLLIKDNEMMNSFSTPKNGWFYTYRHYIIGVWSN